MPRNVVIVGPPRSGTSLTSHVLACAGYFAGEGLRDGDDYNPYGYYEAQDLIDANVSLFESVGFPHHNTWMFEPISEAQIRAIGDLPVQDEHRQLVAAWSGHTPWMWKDPRFSVTLAYWARLIDWSTTGVILTARPAADVYWSFRRKGWCGPGRKARQQTLRLIEMHSRTAERVIESLGLPALRIDYRDYHDRPDEVAAWLSRFAGLNLTASDLPVHRELDHSTGRGRLAGHVRILLKRLPRGPLRRIARLLPESVQTLLLPERRIVAAASPAGRPETPRDEPPGRRAA